MAKLTKKQRELYANVLDDECKELLTGQMRRTAFALLNKLPAGTLKIFTMIGSDGSELGEYIAVPTHSEKLSDYSDQLMREAESRPWFYCTECGEELKPHEKDVEMCDKCREKVDQEEKHDPIWKR